MNFDGALTGSTDPTRRRILVGDTQLRRSFFQGLDLDSHTLFDVYS